MIDVPDGAAGGRPGVLELRDDGHAVLAGIVAAELAADGVLVRAGAGTAVLHAEWLRDNCPCDRCRVVQTDERRHQPWVGPPPFAVAVDVLDGALTVTWDDGHRSTLDATALDAITRAGRRGAPSPVPWTSGLPLVHVGHDAVVLRPRRPSLSVRVDLA